MNFFVSGWVSSWIL